MNTTTVSRLPNKVTATLQDEGPDGWAVFRLYDDRGYTKRTDTIRIGGRHVLGRKSGVWAIEVWRNTGWTHLATARTPSGDPLEREVDWQNEVLRAVAILYGLEDHG